MVFAAFSIGRSAIGQNEFNSLSKFNSSIMIIVVGALAWGLKGVLGFHFFKIVTNNGNWNCGLFAFAC